MERIILKKFDSAQIVEQENDYMSASGEKIFLYKHPITGLFEGVNEDHLDNMREDFASWLRDQLLRTIDLSASRFQKLKCISDFLFISLRKSPPPHPWLQLPADSRPNRNTCNLSYHALLVSAFACAMARTWIELGKSISDLLRFQVPINEIEIPVSTEELIYFIRVASICHDFGKHPPQRHHERGREQVMYIFSGILPELVVFSLSEVAYRHHTARPYRKRGESPIGILEELIAHADTLASAADRPMTNDDREDPVESVTRFLREELGDEYVLSLISADTDRVKSYVYESPRLPEVRGASALLTELNEERIEAVLWNDFQLPPECLLYAAGGSALIVAPTPLAADIADSIQRLYLDETRTATISVVHRPSLPREWVKGIEANEPNFGNLVKWVGYDLRRAKDSRPFYPFFETPAYVRRCDSCEVRPSEQTEIDPERHEICLCAVCKHKRDFGRDKKSAYLGKFEEEFIKLPAGAATPYGRHFTEIKQVEEVHFARDLHEIGAGAEGKAKGYVGVIYTDGNDIGSRIEASRTPAEYRTLSEELLRVTKLATFKALAKRSLLKRIKCSDGQERWIHPFEIVAIGGDDVFLIVPGDVALEIALSICEEFQQQFNHKLTMSAGVLIMHKHFPIYHARELVEMLLKRAKKAGYRAPKITDAVVPAYIDFQVITGDSSLSDDLEGYRKQFYSGMTLFESTHRLIQRPYRLELLGRLLEAARWAQSNFSASQLYQLRQAVVEHVPAWAKNWYRYQLSRDDKEQQAGWRQFHHALFGTDPLRDNEAPWLPSQLGEWTTSVVDLVEILDYVRKEEGGQANGAAN